MEVLGSFEKLFYIQVLVCIGEWKVDHALDPNLPILLDLSIKVHTSLGHLIR